MKTEFKNLRSGSIVLFLLLLLVFSFSALTNCKKDESPPAARACSIKVIDWPDEDNDNQDYAEEHPDALKANSKADMVAKIEKKMKDDNCTCLDKLTILAHGAPGNISVGAGRKTLKCKEIDGHKEEWEETLKPLKGKFCNNAEIILFGCEVGKGEAGAAKLKEVADFFGVKVRAPVVCVYATDDPDDLSKQTAEPDKEKPAPQNGENPDKKLKKKAASTVFLPDPEQTGAVALYLCDRDYWEVPSTGIQYNLEEIPLVFQFFSGMRLENVYDGVGLKVKYNAAGVLRLHDGTEIPFQIVLDWQAIQFKNELASDMYLLSPDAADWLKSVAQ